ncbi:MAG: histidine phosphatase family protein [Desulfobacteraceae bacterium]|nr:histidine phosphatase family protein [Desulfobacteraceae bacterium]
MKTLYLFRHAKSSWKYPHLDDFERPLNNRGRKSALFMGEILKQLNVSPELIISSPATRAAMTARVIADMINYPLEKIRYSETIYLSGKDEIIHVIRDINDAVKKAMVIGHNPAFTDLANYISDQRISNIPTCGVLCMDFNISSWEKMGERCGKVTFFEFPKKHASRSPCVLTNKECIG